MPSEIKIVFDNKDEVFYPGQTVAGHVEVVTTKVKNLRAINVAFVGKSNIKFRHTIYSNTTTSSNFSKKRRAKSSDLISRSESYYDNQYRLWGSGLGGSEFAIGTHQFRFSYTLSPYLPGSFQGTFGYVRHYCKAEMVVELGSNKEVVSPYTVNASYDLNYDPQSRLQVYMAKEDATGPCCFTTGNYSFEARVGKMGFVPGEKIYINAVINNATSNKIHPPKASIIQRTTYIGSKEKVTNRTVASVNGHEISPGQNDTTTWVNKALKIPAVVSSLLAYCKLIDVTYYLKFEFVLGNYLKSVMEEEKLIVVGSIPLRNVPTANPMGTQQPNPQYNPQQPNPQYNPQQPNYQYGPQHPNPQYGPQYNPQQPNPQYNPQQPNPQYNPQQPNPQYNPQQPNPQYNPQQPNPQYNPQQPNPQYGFQSFGPNMSEKCNDLEAEEQKKLLSSTDPVESPTTSSTRQTTNSTPAVNPYTVQYEKDTINESYDDEDCDFDNEGDEKKVDFTPKYVFYSFDNPVSIGQDDIK